MFKLRFQERRRVPGGWEVGDHEELWTNKTYFAYWHAGYSAGRCHQALRPHSHTQVGRDKGQCTGCAEVGDGEGEGHIYTELTQK